MNYAVVALCAITALNLPAQTYTTIYRFDGSDGASPSARLSQGLDGALYSTTFEGGASSRGTLFKITPAGSLTTLYNFCPQTPCTDGEYPLGALAQSLDGTLFGATLSGGFRQAGTIFKITPDGMLATLHSFDIIHDGSSPEAGLDRAVGGEFFGTAVGGGVHGSGKNFAGTVFKVTPDGAFTTLYSFCSETNCADGAGPTGLVQAGNGDFYGTTNSGGLYSAGSTGTGTLFKMTSAGALTTLYNFCAKAACADGANPAGTLIQATDGNFYGTTFSGGANNGGSFFRFTPAGALATLYSFATGANPGTELVQGTDGNFYGVTPYDGPYKGGTIFRLTPRGELTILHNFCDYCTDGSNPQAALIQATDGDFYGTTAYGGANGYGTVFRLSVGLGPFVKLHPSAGKPATEINVLGANLTGATSVTFNGAPATFRVVSATLIVATVPGGATTGKVQVLTPNGTLFSNVAFRALP